MGVQVVMELYGDNDDLHARRLTALCNELDRLEGIRSVQSCLITTGKVTIEEEVQGEPHRRPQVRVR